MEDVLVHLKAVFEACDQNGDGFVKTQDLLRLGQEHSSVGFEVSLRFLCYIDFYYAPDHCYYYEINSNHNLTGVQNSGSC